MGLQVWDNGKSERHLVMRWIVAGATLRKQADFGIGLSGRERMTNPLREGKQIKAVATLACAPSTASGVDIITSIAQVVVVATASRKRCLRGLSRVR